MTSRAGAGAQGGGAGTSNTGAGAQTPPGAPQEPQEQGAGGKDAQGAQGSPPKGTQSPGARRERPAEGKAGAAVDARRNGGVMLSAFIPLFNTWLGERPATIEVEGTAVAVTRIDPERFTLHAIRHNNPFEVEQVQPEHINNLIKKVVAARQGLV